MVLEGSHRRMDPLLEHYVYRDVDVYCENKPKEAERRQGGKIGTSPARFRTTLPSCAHNSAAAG